MLLAGVLAIAGGAPLPGRAQNTACTTPAPGRAYVERVDRVLRAKQDVWGNELLTSREGPTYEGVRRRLAPLVLAGAPGQTAATESGVHYLALGQPDGVGGADTVALHVADGSQIVSDRMDGPRLTIGVGDRGGERYGSCLSRLSGSRLADGYLPILDTTYTDSAGVRYRQESFVARVPGTRPLVSFVEIVADAHAATAPAELRVAPSQGSALTHTIAPGATLRLLVSRTVTSRSSKPVAVDPATYEAARRSVIAYWTRRLAEGAAIDVPEQRVENAWRNLLVQDLTLTWRYSIGNPYEEFSFPEGVDVAQAMSAQGFSGVARAILARSLTRPPEPYPNWKMGQKLVGSALYFRLSGDRSYIDQVTPVLRRYVESLGRQVAASSRGILDRERYSSDIADSVYGLHSQAVAWQGIRAMGQVWDETGRTSLAARCRSLAARLGTGLRQAVRESQRRLPDGSLFVPVRLLDRETAYDALTTSRPGSYWNLVAPYAFASGLFPPNGAQAEGALRYLLLHGSRLLGLVRAGAYALYGKAPTYPESGTDQVYGLNVARFLADNDRPDQLVLSLYGQLGAAMTPDTYVSGEAASVAPLGGSYYRSTYLPPNGAANGTFLETLRLMLVHETRASDGSPRGLELAYSTPRAWLRPGRHIAVRRRPDELRPALVHDRVVGRSRPGLARRSRPGSAPRAPPSTPSPPRRPHHRVARRRPLPGPPRGQGDRRPPDAGGPPRDRGPCGPELGVGRTPVNSAAQYCSCAARSLDASVRSSTAAICGSLRRSFAKTARPITIRVTSPTAVMSADRGAPSSRAISPKESPAFSPTGGPFGRSTRTSPSRTT